MKRVIDVRYGTQPISKVYFAGKVVWEKYPKTKVIVTAVGDIQTDALASTETRYCTELSLMGTVGTSAVARPEPRYCTELSLMSVESVDAAVSPEVAHADAVGGAGGVEIIGRVFGEKIKPQPVRQADVINIVTRANPKANIVSAYGITKITTTDRTPGRSIPVIAAASIDEVILHTVGEGRSAPVAPIASGDIIKVGASGYARNIGTNTIDAHGDVRTLAVADADSGLKVYAGSHSRIVLDSTTIADTVNGANAHAHTGIDIDGTLVASRETITDAASHGDINMRQVAYAHSAANVGAQSHGIIDADSYADAITWIFPVLSGNTLTIIQAYDTNDENIPILEVI